MRVLYAIVFSACLLLAAPNAASARTTGPDCGSTALTLWQEAINNDQGTIDQRAERVAHRYATGAAQHEVLFLPTASPYLVTTRAKIIDYFKGFLETKPKVTFTECKVIAPPGSVVLLAGFYYFTNTKDCLQGRLLARFSFLVRRSDNIIVHHHSSVLPPDNPCRTQ
jgi:hypothetical protein